VRRDSLYGEAVLWSGRPKVVTTPIVYRVGAVLCAVTAAISTAFAVIVATSLHARPGGLLAFAAWMSTLAITLDFGPRWWRSQLEFLVTDKAEAGVAAARSAALDGVDLVVAVGGDGTVRGCAEGLARIVRQAVAPVEVRPKSVVKIHSASSAHPLRPPR